MNKTLRLALLNTLRAWAIIGVLALVVAAFGVTAALFGNGYPYWGALAMFISISVLIFWATYEDAKRELDNE